MNAIDKVRKFAEDERSEREASYHQLVAKVALNKAPAAGEFSSVLSASGKKLADFEADVVREKRINELRELIKQRPAAMKSMEETRQAEDECNLQNQRIFQEMRANSQKVRGTALEARYRLQEIESAAVELERLTGGAVVFP